MPFSCRHLTVSFKLGEAVILTASVNLCIFNLMIITFKKAMCRHIIYVVFNTM